MAERMINLFGKRGHCVRYHFDAEWLCKRVFGDRSTGNKKRLRRLLVFRQRFKWDRAMGQQTLHDRDKMTGASDDRIDDALFFQQAGAPFITKLTPGGMRPGKRVLRKSCFLDGKMFGRCR